MNDFKEMMTLKVDYSAYVESAKAELKKTLEQQEARERKTRGIMNQSSMMYTSSTVKKGAK
jgi:hypothetical protein